MQDALRVLLDAKSEVGDTPVDTAWVLLQEAPASQVQLHARAHGSARFVVTPAGSSGPTAPSPTTAVAAGTAPGIAPGTAPDIAPATSDIAPTVPGATPAVEDYLEKLLHLESDDARRAAIHDIQHLVQACLSHDFAMAEAAAPIYRKALGSGDIDWIHFVLFVTLVSCDSLYNMLHHSCDAPRLQKFAVEAQRVLSPLLLRQELPLPTVPSKWADMTAMRVRRAVWHLRYVY